MNKWEKSQYGGQLPTFSLSKEFDPDWFASVYPRDGKYIFTIGERIKENKPTPTRYNWVGKGWKSPETAKTKALEQLNIKKLGL
jgi:hypothetical protein